MLKRWLRHLLSCYVKKKVNGHRYFKHKISSSSLCVTHFPFPKCSLEHYSEPDRSNSVFFSLVCGMVSEVHVMYFSMTWKSPWNLWSWPEFYCSQIFPNNLSLTSILMMNTFNLNFLLAYRQLNRRNHIRKLHLEEITGSKSIKTLH